MKHLSIVVLLLGVFAPSVSQSSQFLAHTYTTHIGPLPSVETFGIGYRNNANYQFGYIPSNSYDEESFYLAKIYRLNPYINIGVGAISGYVIERGMINGSNDASLIPLVAMEVELNEVASVYWFTTALNLVIRW